MPFPSIRCTIVRSLAAAFVFLTGRGEVVECLPLGDASRGRLDLHAYVEGPETSTEGLGYIGVTAFGKLWDVYFAPTAARAQAYRDAVARGEAATVAETFPQALEKLRAAGLCAQRLGQ